MRDLAIVIPAYKEAYFYKALESLAQQTNQDFSVYIGDDFSPFDLKKIADQFAGQLDIHYTRFPFNIGSKNLVNQWSRCIELSANENWLWLFSDDDIAAPNCVESFYRHLEKNHDRFDVYRFNTCLIDTDGKITREPLVSPDEESSEAMAYNLLLGKRGNSMPDHIFSRKVYRESGGLVFTSYAQSADWAASILFSKEKGLAVLQDATVYWRQSGQNVSSVASHSRTEMIKGYLSFLEWLDNHFEYLDEKFNPAVTRQMIKEAAWKNFNNVMEHHYKGFAAADFSMLSDFIQQYFKISRVNAFVALGKIKALVMKQETRVRLSKIKRKILK